MISKNADITLFNGRLSNDRREVMFPTVIKGVSLKDDYGTSGSVGSQSGSQSAKIRIPIDADTEGKTYVDAETYKDMSDEEASNHWTIANNDLVVPFEVHPTEEVHGTSELEQLYGKAFVVNSYADNTSRGLVQMRHWRIGGV